MALGCGSSGDTATVPGGPRPVSVALSWAPNTDYTGMYVAQQLGFYSKRGITLRILPYASTPPEQLIGSGKADTGFSYQAGVAYARASGKDVVAIFAPDQKDTYAIGVSAKRGDIKSPKDLDGKTYAGFGTPDEGPELKTVIRNAGGKGDFRTVTLNTSAYEAVHSGQADFTIPITTWEGVEASLAGKPFKYFRLEDFGFPQQYSVLIAANGRWLKDNPTTARAFVAATREGYAFAAAKPEEAAKLMIAANPGAFKNPKLVTESQKLLAEGGYLKTADGKVGVQSAEQWRTYGRFLFANGLLTDGNGRKLTREPNWDDHFTNSLLPSD